MALVLRLNPVTRTLEYKEDIGGSCDVASVQPESIRADQSPVFSPMSDLLSMTPISLPPPVLASSSPHLSVVSMYSSYFVDSSGVIHIIDTDDEDVASNTEVEEEEGDGGGEEDAEEEEEIVPQIPSVWCLSCGERHPEDQTDVECAIVEGQQRAAGKRKSRPPMRFTPERDDEL